MDGLYLDAELFALTAQRSIEPRDNVLPVGPARVPFPGVSGPLCSCCSHIWRDCGNGRREPDRHPAVARWNHRGGNTSLLCQNCLDGWLDNADDDPDLEPASWSWLRGARTVA